MSATAGTAEAAGDAESDLTITEWEVQEVEKANAAGKQPIVFVHGLWLLPNSWDPWREVFEDAGYVTAAPGWPDDPETTEEAKEHPEVFAKKSVGKVADHYEEVIRALDKKPAIIGHSFGGLLTEILAGRGLAVASVPISPAPLQGRAAASVRGAKDRFGGASQSRQPQPCGPTDLRPVQVQLREHARQRRGRGGL